MLSRRDIYILKIAKKSDGIIWGDGKCLFSLSELRALCDEGSLTSSDFSIDKGEGNIPIPGKKFSISSRGEWSIKEYRSSSLIAKATLIVSIAGAIIGLIAWLLPR